NIEVLEEIRSMSHMAIQQEQAIQRKQRTKKAKKVYCKTADLVSGYQEQNLESEQTSSTNTTCTMTSIEEFILDEVRNKIDNDKNTHRKYIRTSKKTREDRKRLKTGLTIYDSNKRKGTPKNPNELVDELKKFFLIKKVTELQYLEKYRKKLLKFYSFERMLPSYFQLLLSKLQLSNTLQKLNSAIREMFPCNPKDKNEKEEKSSLLLDITEITSYLQNAPDEDKVQLPINNYTDIQDTITTLKKHLFFNGILPNIMNLPNLQEPEWE
ncbi:30226_t:CDS:2, partial [Gigaspora margarita]